LLSVLQPLPKVVGIEEPEASIHPALLEMIMEILMLESAGKQVLITTHSPEVLDQKELSDSQIRMVYLKKGQTMIAPLSDANRDIIRERLYSPGELLKMNEIQPDDDGPVEIGVTSGFASREIGVTSGFASRHEIPGVVLGGVAK
ncbi:MAG: AAA family ATPase, partial [Pseudomonadota bacterium]